ncbi:hypothetical protein ILUMI_12758 [Ignelater luminosus]|uniref:Sphingomyelin phosphodiesterase n=1 Tax=Ignelater luminosus TaxID=2038154 RepID=A0A8K0GBH4_IGNLU|nr:hypothetical protein ILUMI_12758 [Ignelater luminosus]
MWSCLFKFILLTSIGSSIIHGVEEVVPDTLENSIKQGLEGYLNNEKSPAELNQTIRDLQRLNLFRTKDKSLSKASCTACKAGLDVLINARRKGVEKEKFLDVLTKLCAWLKLESEPVCHATVALHIDSLAYIVDNKKDLTSKRVCSIILQEHGCEDPDRKNWTIDIPASKEKPLYVRKECSKSKSLKILQLTDIHYDPGYEAGSNGACQSAVCCQNGSKPSQPENAAGYWSDYRFCDTPWYMITNSIDHILTHHTDLNYIYFTGDILYHKVWDTSIPGNTQIIRDVLQEFKKLFGTTPIYPTLGNHESHPVNLFSTEGVDEPQLSTQWLYDLAAEEWKTWLPIETRETILKGGFYTTLIKPGFRIISLNSNVCYTYNWWLLYDDVDPYGQLQWLVKVLLDAEENNEVVHIISHVPNGDDNCLHNWSREYSKIINRFAHMIAAQFTGHTHHDETLIFFNISNPSQAINVAYNGGSLTTWAHVNPNYKIYEIDSESAEVLDYETWIFNVTDANLSPNISPNWYKLYSFKDAYGVDNLCPHELARLTERMAKTPSLTQLYFRYKYKEADTMLARGCNNQCEIDNLCRMVISYSECTQQCETLKEIYNFARH